MPALPPKAGAPKTSRSHHQNRNSCRDGAVSARFAMSALPPIADISQHDCHVHLRAYGWGRRMAPQVAIEPTTRSQNGNMLRPGMASAINPGRITHFRPSRRNRSSAVTRSTAHWTGSAMSSQKDKPSEIAATANAAAKRFLSAAPNRHLLYPR